MLNVCKAAIWNLDCQGLLLTAAWRTSSAAARPSSSTGASRCLRQWDTSRQSNSRAHACFAACVLSVVACVVVCCCDDRLLSVIKFSLANNEM